MPEFVRGRECTIIIKTTYQEKCRNAERFCLAIPQSGIALPYSDETIREAVSILKEEAAIEGDGVCRALRKPAGVTGCVVTPLTMGSAPLLFALALGNTGAPVFVSETRGMYRHSLTLGPCETGVQFDLIQTRGPIRRLYEGCRVEGFEFRVNKEGGMPDTPVNLKLDICGDMPGVTYPYQNVPSVESEEYFEHKGVRYAINGAAVTGIYGLTIRSVRKGGIKTEVSIKRLLLNAGELPPIIENLTVTAELFHTRYGEENYSSVHYGLFRLNLSRLVLMADETDVDSAGAVVGPMRYYCAGNVTGEVFTSNEEGIV
jgi:hypothetical protein